MRTVVCSHSTQAVSSTAAYFRHACAFNLFWGKCTDPTKSLSAKKQIFAVNTRCWDQRLPSKACRWCVRNLLGAKLWVHSGEVHYVRAADWAITSGNSLTNKGSKPRFIVWRTCEEFSTTTQCPRSNSETAAVTTTLLDFFLLFFPLYFRRRLFWLFSVEAALYFR